MKTVVCGSIVAVYLSCRSRRSRRRRRAGREPSWAFPAINRTLPAEEGAKSVPGSSKSYTPAQIDDLMNPPDWFPDEHAPAPPLVQKGHGAALACGACHLMSGEGHPESAGLTGFTAAYLVQQMADFKSGARKDSARMNAIAKDVSDEESRQVAEWFAALKPRRVDEGHRSRDGAEDDRRPGAHALRAAGRRRSSRSATASSPCPRISREREAAIRTRASSPTCRQAASRKARRSSRRAARGKTIACGICHGDTLQGLGNVPRLAGLHPDLHRASALSVQGRHAKRRRRAADEEAGRAPDRRRHPRDCRRISASL